MIDIQTFSSPQFGDIRTSGTSDKPMFCLADVCRVLELQVSPTKNRLKQDGVNLIKVTDSLGREQEAIFVNEPNLYRVIMRSDKPQAEAFQDWVCSEVLPSIRKTGGYISTKAEDTPEEIMARALLVAQETIARREERIKALQDKIDEDAPKVLFANAVDVSKDSILIGELARILKQNGVEIGQNRLFEWLRANGYLCKCGEQRNQPTQKALNAGLFEIKKNVVMRPDGSSMVTTTTKTTYKGQQYFVNKFVGGQLYE